ncbi:MAG: hypothetical protein ACD_41C00105G0002 [uncultured bacterium]|nr:MAG: hypothetical protein ACD_41C00105G0002 [uncultured bacterium]
MKKLSLIILIVVGLITIGLFILFYRYQPVVVPAEINPTPTWTTAVANEVVIVQLDTASPDGYSFTLEPFGRLVFARVGEIQTSADQQIQLVSVTSTSAQVLVSTKSAE